MSIYVSKEENIYSNSYSSSGGYIANITSGNKAHISPISPVTVTFRIFDFLAILHIVPPPPLIATNVGSGVIPLRL
jgi:hypothetical protein